MVGPRVLEETMSRSTLNNGMSSNAAHIKDEGRYQTARNSIEDPQYKDLQDMIDKKKNAQTIVEEMEGQDLYLEAETGRSRDSPLSKWQPKFDSY